MVFGLGGKSGSAGRGHEGNSDGHRLFVAPRDGSGYTESHDKKCLLAVDLIKKTDHDKDWKVSVIGSGCCTSPPPRLAMR